MMKIKDMVNMQGKFSAHDVGEVQLEICEDTILAILIDENLGFDKDYLCDLANTIRECGIIKERVTPPYIKKLLKK